MWRNCRLSSSWQTFANNQQGASAILLAVGLSLLLVIAVLIVSGQSKSELQMSAAEASSEQEQALIAGAFNDALKQAENTTWPASPFDGHNPCSLAGGYPRYCLDVLSRPPGGGPLSIPLRITYQISSRSAVKYAYGWIVINGTNLVTGFRYSHTWCTYQTNSTLRTKYGPCVQGG